MNCVIGLSDTDFVRLYCGLSRHFVFSSTECMGALDCGFGAFRAFFDGGHQTVWNTGRDFSGRLGRNLGDSICAD